MKPIDLELPEQFASWRPGQLETAAKMAASQKYAFLLDAPTGIGKSLIAAAIQKLTESRMRYLCTTKQLQDQLLADFPYAVTVKGRNNYPCLKFPRMFPEVTAEDCTHEKPHKCKHINGCPYHIAKSKALGADLAILNTSYFLHEANYVGGFSDNQILVLDEFDTIEDQLMNFIEVVITKRQIDRMDIPPPKYKTKFESWVEWARVAVKQLSEQILPLRLEMEGAWATTDFASMKRLRAMEKLHSKLKFFINEVDSTWVWYPGEDRWAFKPVWVAKYAENALWRYATKIVGMSATILSPRQVSINTGLWLRTHGVFDYLGLPSPFPKENRPVYYEPCANVVNRNMSVALPKLAKAITRIMDTHPNEKILVHTVSYKVRGFLLDHLPVGRTITHSTRDRNLVLDKFKKSAKPLVLLSPSMDRGVDLPEEECRVVVVAKCPYADISDPQVSRRVYGSKDGNAWYAHKTISRIVQMSGRAVRSMDDYAVTYILDEQYGKLSTEHREMFPKWFLEAVIT